MAAAACICHLAPIVSMQARGRGPDRDLTSHNHNRDTSTPTAAAPFSSQHPIEAPCITDETTHIPGGPGGQVLVVAAVALGSHGSDGLRSKVMSLPAARPRWGVLLTRECSSRVSILGCGVLKGNIIQCETGLDIPTCGESVMVMLPLRLRRWSRPFKWCCRWQNDKSLRVSVACAAVREESRYADK